MDRRQAGGTPALWRRIRWGNVGRVALLLAAGLVLLASARGCRAGPPALAPAPVDSLPRERPLSEAEPTREKRRAKRREPTARPREGARAARPRRARRRRPSSGEGKGVVVPMLPVQPPAPAVDSPPAAPPPSPPPPASRRGEFTPDLPP